MNKKDGYAISKREIGAMMAVKKRERFRVGYEEGKSKGRGARCVLVVVVILLSGAAAALLAGEHADQGQQNGVNFFAVSLPDLAPALAATGETKRWAVLYLVAPGLGGSGGGYLALTAVVARRGLYLACWSWGDLTWDAIHLR